MFSRLDEIAKSILPSGGPQQSLLMSQLHGAAVWCKKNLRVDDPAGSLRTKALKPEMVVLVRETDGWWNAAVSNPETRVNELCRVRDAGVVPSGDITQPLPEGRVLLFYPLESLCDGAAWESSKGYFDQWNIPPWDTWFWYARAPNGRDVLYTWVPSELADIASIGVSVNPEECLVWLNEP